MSTAPVINRITVESVAANFIKLSWENLGGGFLYKLERTEVVSPESWTTILDNSELVEYYDSGLTAETVYKYRVTTKKSGYTDSDPYESTNITTFETNSYTLLSKDSVLFFDDYLLRKFTNDENHINFNTDEIEVQLVDENYEYNKTNTNITDLQSSFLTTPERMRLYGTLPTACRGISGLMPFYANNTVFIFERGQSVIRMTNDLGKNWFADQASFRVGSPLGAQCCVQIGNNLIILGYDGIYSFDISSKITKNTDIDDLMTRIADYPSGVPMGTIDSITATVNYVYLTANNFIYRFEYPITSSPVTYEQNTWSSNSASRCKNMLPTFSGSPDGIIICSPGEWDSVEDKWIPSISYSGLYSLSDESSFGASPSPFTFSNPFNVFAYIKPGTFNISYNGTNHIIDAEIATNDLKSLIISGSPPAGEYDPLYPTAQLNKMTNARFTRLPVDWNISGFIDFRFEKYQYETQFIYNDEHRIWINDLQQIAIIFPEKTYIQSLQNTSETFSDGTTTIYADPFTFTDILTSTSGAVFYEKSSGDLIGFHNLPVTRTGDVTFNWSNLTTVLQSVLSIGSLTEESVITATEPRDAIPRLDPMVIKVLPQYHIDKEPIYAKFVELYLKYISETSYENYGQLYNLIKNHDVNETEFFDLFETDLIKRNVTSSTEKYNELVKFVNNHAYDIYSIKGTEDSYEFMFKLLYNADVTVKVESDYNFVYQIDVGIQTINDIPAYSFTSDEIEAYAQSYLSESIVQLQPEEDNPSAGRIYADIVRVQFKENAADDSIPDEYTLPIYTLSLTNLYGDFELGKNYKITATDEAIVTTKSTLTTSDINITDDQFLDDDIAFGFPLRVEVNLPVNIYKNDMIRFVHPAGFPFVGVFLLTSFVNSGLTFDHLETIIDFYSTISWDSGIPSVYPTTIPSLDTSSEYQYDINGDIVTQAEPNGLGGLPFPASTSPVRPEETLHGVGGATYEAAQSEGSPYTYGLSPLDRRKANSPLFSSSWGRFTDRLYLPNLRLKDNVLVGSPGVATQQKVGEL